MARRALLDTGFVVALVNAEDPDHEPCVRVWRETRAQLFSVEGVLVESAHMLRKTKAGVAAAVHLLQDAGTQLVSMSELDSKRVLELMAKYHDVPMDFVDALLVAVAERHAVREVLTLDRRGFGSYRVNGRERFQILP